MAKETPGTEVNTRRKPLSCLISNRLLSERESTDVSSQRDMSAVVNSDLNSCQPAFDVEAPDQFVEWPEA